MSVCDNFQTVLYRRGELTGEDLQRVNDHVARCQRCHEVLLEIERFEDVLHEWRAPAPPQNLADKVIAQLRGEADAASCDTVRENIHHYISQDLESWRIEPIDAHLKGCLNCAELLDECRQSRRTWMSWQAPEPPTDLTANVMVNVTAKPRQTTARRYTPTASRGPWLPRLTRFAAAAVLVLAGITAGLLLDDFRSDFADSPERALAPVALENHRLTLRELDLYSHEPGLADVTDSFSSRHRSERGHILRNARQSP